MGNRYMVYYVADMEHAVHMDTGVFIYPPKIRLVLAGAVTFLLGVLCLLGCLGRFGSFGWLRVIGGIGGIGFLILTFLLFLRYVRRPPVVIIDELGVTDSSPVFGFGTLHWKEIRRIFISSNVKGSQKTGNIIFVPDDENGFLAKFPKIVQTVFRENMARFGGPVIIDTGSIPIPVEELTREIGKYHVVEERESKVFRVSS
jgi:hypothetical protein